MRHTVMLTKHDTLIKKFLCITSILALAIGMMSTVATAQDLTETLAKIKNNGVVVVGYRKADVPFSYLNNNGEPIGYSIEISKAIVDRIKERLNMPDLNVRWLPITSQNRIPLVRNGTFDFGCNSTTHNAPRAEKVGFSDSIFVISTRLLTKKKSEINGFDDLEGKTVVVGAGRPPKY